MVGKFSIAEYYESNKGGEQSISSQGVNMELQGVVHNGVIVPDSAMALEEGTRVRFEPMIVANQKTFGQIFGDLMLDCPDLPTDLADQHEHYRLGTPKR